MGFRTVLVCPAVVLCLAGAAAGQAPAALSQDATARIK